MKGPEHGHNLPYFHHEDRLLLAATTTPVAHLSAQSVYLHIVGTGKVEKLGYSTNVAELALKQLQDRIKSNGTASYDANRFCHCLLGKGQDGYVPLRWLHS